MSKDPNYFKSRNLTDSTPIVICKNLHINYYKATFYGYSTGWNMRNKICDNKKLTTLTSCLSEFYTSFGFPLHVLSRDKNGYPYSLNSLYKEITSWHLVENCLDKAATVLHTTDDKANTINELGTIFFMQLDITIGNLFMGFYLSDPLQCINEKETLIPVIDKFESSFRFLLEEIDYLMGRDRNQYYHQIVENYAIYNNLRSTWYAKATAESNDTK